MFLNRLISFTELRKIASELKIPNVGRFNKEELINEIEKVDSGIVEKEVIKLKREYF